MTTQGSDNISQSQAQPQTRTISQRYLNKQNVRGKIKMPQGLMYKWEKNSGLDHKCGICKTVLSSPRAKKTCFGVHEEVCPKYHFTLFYVGNTNKCDACRKSAEQHDKRHREIAMLILDVRKIDADSESMSPSYNRKRKAKNSDTITEYHEPNTTSEAEESWADSTTLNDDGSEDQLPQGLTLKENVVLRERTKAEKKKLRHRELAQVITPELLSAINAIIHPGGKPLNSNSDSLYAGGDPALNDRVIEDNIRYNSNCFRPSSLRPSVRERRLLKSNGIGRAPSPINALESPEITFMLERLGIFDPRAHGSKDRAILIKKLRFAIKSDAETVENEDRDTMMRMAGYWRYVNRKTYNHMVRHNEIWDWATGQSLEEVEEDEEGERDAHDDLATKGATLWDYGYTIRDTSSDTDTHLGEIGKYVEGFNLDNESPSPFFRFHEEANDEDMNLTPKVYHHDGFALASKSSSSTYPPLDPPQNRKHAPSTSTDSLAALTNTQDKHHTRPPPTSISTLKTDEPFTIVLEPSPSTPKAPNGARFAAPHRDRNNRYTPLAELPAGNDINEPLGRVNRHLKIKPARSPLPSGKENDVAWTTVTGKGMSYAAVAGRR